MGKKPVASNHRRGKRSDEKEIERYGKIAVPGLQKGA